jgi:putative ABC transport system permease protein
MFTYYLGLGLRHLRRNPALTTLMVITLAVGVAASMSTLTVLRGMMGDPIPDRSDRLFVPNIDIRPNDGSEPDPEPPSQLSYRDAMALQAAKKGVRQTPLVRIGPAVQPAREGQPPFFAEGLAVHSDFFAMLGIRFVRGGAWTAADDDKAAAVVVITEEIASRVFGDADPLGKTMRIAGRDVVVTGVIADDWEPLPRFYRLIGGPGAYGGDDQLIVPFATAMAREMDPQGQISCFADPGPGYEGLKHSECVWIQYWVELASAADAPAYRDFLAGYVAEQRKLGRFPKPDNQRLYNAMEWLDVNKVVSKDRRLQTYLAFGFLLVCLINTIGLLLAKFGARSGEIGVRRALGATRRAVFLQYIIECGVVGLAGGVVGLGLTFLCLWMLGKQSDQAANVAHMNWVMLGVTFAVAVAASVLAGLLPTWRACKVQPALQLKSQ